MQNEPNYDVAHLGHVELLTPKPDESLRFFTDVLGLTESGRKGESVYLRGWDDYERHTVLRNRMVCGAARSESKSEEPGAAVSGAWRQRPETRACGVSRFRRQGEPGIFRALPRLPSD